MYMKKKNHFPFSYLLLEYWNNINIILTVIDNSFVDAGKRYLHKALAGVTISVFVDKFLLSHANKVLF